MKKKLIIVGGVLFLSLFVIIFLFRPKEESQKPIKNTISSIQFSDELILLKPSETFKTTIIKLPEDISEKILYIINDDNVASVNESGLVTGKNEGTAILTAISESGKTTETSIVVKKEEIGEISVEQITINSQNINLLIGQTYKIESSILPDNSTNKSITYTTSNEKVVSVGESGIVKANAIGDAIVTLTASNGIQNSIMFGVTSTIVDISSIKIFPSEAELVLGQNLTLNLLYTPSNVTNKSNVTWSSSNSNVVEVNEGVITAKNIGNAVITASINGKKSTTNIIVNSLNSTNNIIPVKSINLTKSEISLTVNKTSQIQYDILPSDATNKKVSFESSNTNVFTVSNTGLIKGVGQGLGILTACSNNGICEKVSIKVTSNTILPESIYLNIEEVTLKIGDSKQLRATLIPLNTTSSNLIWVTGSSAVASVSNTGLITAKSYGTTTVSAITTNGKIAKVKVNVPQNNPDFPYGEILVRSETIPSGNMGSAELQEINQHLTNYINEASENAIRLGNINPKRVKVMAAAYWLTNNPFYRVQYGFGSLSKYNVDGWNPKWSNTVGVECSGFVFWSLKQAGAYQYYSTTSELQHSGEFKDNGNDDFTVDQLIGLGIEPGDVLRKSRTTTENGHWSIVMNVNKNECYIDVAHAVSTTEDTKMTRYKCGTTIKYQHLYKLPAFYQDDAWRASH